MTRYRVTGPHELVIAGTRYTWGDELEADTGALGELLEQLAQSGHLTVVADTIGADEPTEQE